MNLRAGALRSRHVHPLRVFAIVDDRSDVRQPVRTPNEIHSRGEMEPTIGIEPMTFSLPWRCSTD